MKNDEKFIKWKIDPVKHAYGAYKDEYYIEAIQVLHGWIEAAIRELLMMSRHGNIRRVFSEMWDIAEETGYNYLSRALLIIGKISQKEYKELQEFNSLRNKIVHKFFYEPYDKEYKGVPLKDYDRLFKRGIKLAKKMESRSESLLWRRSKTNKK
jgi:hypothetical protein